MTDNGKQWPHNHHVAPAACLGHTKHFSVLDSDHLKMYFLHRETNRSGKRDTLRKTVQVNESQPSGDDSKGYTACACSMRAGTQPPPLHLLPLGLPSGRMLIKSSRVVGRR